MTRRLIFRSNKVGSGQHCTVSADAEANACVVRVMRGAEVLGEVAIPGGLVLPVVDGIETAFKNLPRPYK